jgi:hypothetical protein
MGTEATALTGGCDCGGVRYELTRTPLYVHCCHCTWCQRETGSAFALNALIETTAVKLTQGEPQMIKTPSESGSGQLIARCPDCQLALWSHYGGRNTAFSFVKVGTLDQPSLLPPDIHIFTRSKQAWLSLPDDALQFEAYYHRDEHWPADSLQRFYAEVERHKQPKADQ